MNDEVHLREILRKNGNELPLLLEIPVNSHFMIGIYQGTISENDMLIQYRQKDDDGKWSAQRTPKHIHWAVDILIKMNEDQKNTSRLIDFLIEYWNNNAVSLKDRTQRDNFLNKENLMNAVNAEAGDYPELANKGEYSVKFLILLAKLLMTQEKTNYENAYMFKNLLDQLKEHKDIFKIVSTATHH